MCKFEDIIRTTPQDVKVKEGQGKNISLTRIEFNTDIVFALAKKLEKPLDETLSLMKKTKANSYLFSIFGKRKQISQKEIVNNLHNHIVAVL